MASKMLEGARQALVAMRATRKDAEAQCKGLERVKEGVQAQIKEALVMLQKVKAQEAELAQTVAQLEEEEAKTDE